MLVNEDTQIKTSHQNSMFKLASCKAEKDPTICDSTPETCTLKLKALFNHQKFYRVTYKFTYIQYLGTVLQRMCNNRRLYRAIWFQ